ncbi:unnamed protein product [Rangifer tarandus platyrhynchus]
MLISRYGSFWNFYRPYRHRGLIRSADSYLSKSELTLLQLPKHSSHCRQCLADGDCASLGLTSCSLTRSEEVSPAAGMAEYDRVLASRARDAVFDQEERPAPSQPPGVQLQHRLLPAPAPLHPRSKGGVFSLSRQPESIMQHQLLPAQLAHRMKTP